MECSHPILAESHWDPIQQKWSKPRMHRDFSEDFRKSLEEFSNRHNHHVILSDFLDCGGFFFDYKNSPHRVFYIPCGQCMECRLNYAREWTIRTTLESTLYKNNLFFTFTYDDAHLPPVPVDSPTERHPLDYEGFTRFVKRLRDHIQRDFGRTFRFLYCGEYGDLTLRPHYHMIMLDAPSLDQLQCKVYKRKPFLLYTSPYIEKIWNNGFCPIGIASYEDIGYVCRYILKKFIGKKDDVEAYYKKLGVPSEKRFQSRMPGIGQPWLLRHMSDVYDDSGFCSVPTSCGSYLCKPPVYFDDLYLQFGGDRLKLFQRTIDQDYRNRLKRDQALMQTSLDELQQRAVKHDNFIHKCEMLYHRDIQSHGK